MPDLNQVINHFAEKALPMYEANNWQWSGVRSPNGGWVHYVPSLDELIACTWELVECVDRILADDTNKDVTYATTGRIMVMATVGGGGTRYSVTLDIA